MLKRNKAKASIFFSSQFLEKNMLGIVGQWLMLDIAAFQPVQCHRLAGLNAFEAHPYPSSFSYYSYLAMKTPNFQIFRKKM
jgi:hypothetical protein